MSQDTLNLLLGWLDADFNQAAERYNQIQKKLIVFFESRCAAAGRGNALAEECASETLDRVARIVAEGKQQIEKREGFILGVARNIFRETLRKPLYETLEPDDPLALPSPVPDEQKERLHVCCERCLAKQPAEGQRLILDYYCGEKREKIDHRKALAAQLGISINVLRIRACRVRAELENCIRECCEAGAEDLK